MVLASSLFEPLQWCGLRLKNRIVMAPMVSDYASEEGEVTLRVIGYYGEHADGGPGLITLEATAVARDGRLSPNELGLWSDDLQDGIHYLVERIHNAGAKVSIQLNHAGRQSGFLARSGMGLVAPSPIPSPTLPLSRPRELDIPEIRALVEAFASAAGRAAAAGADAIEIHAAHGFLINQFLSPFANYREDDYGGDFVGRMRFPLEVLAAVKRAAGSGLPVGVRISADEYVAGGNRASAGAVIARSLAERGADFIHVSAGFPGGTAPPEPTGATLSSTALLAKGVKQVLRINELETPVTAVGRVLRPETARQIIEDGVADLVAIGRALLADPLWVRKAAAGLENDIRYCAGCHDCIHHDRGCPPLVSPRS
ncbi:MAG TPA: hypothetical protein VGL40_11970 [Bacillota bacterium]